MAGADRAGSVISKRHYLFVTDDNGFKEDGKLHPDLHADLAAAGVDADDIRLYLQVHPVLEYLSAVELVDKDGDDEKDEKTEDGGIGNEEDEGTDGELSDVPDYATWRAAITQALWEYNDVLKDLTWTRTPSHDGDYYYPEWEIGLPNALEDTELTAIDGPFEVSIGVGQVKVDQPVVCKHQVTLSFSGFMSKFEWYGLDDDAEMYLVDGDWNDYTVIVEAARTVEQPHDPGYLQQRDG